jgi:hypothetical protein
MASPTIWIAHPQKPMISPPVRDLGCGHVDLHISALGGGCWWDQETVVCGVHHETANTVSRWSAVSWLDGQIFATVGERTEQVGVWVDILPAWTRGCLHDHAG